MKERPILMSGPMVRAILAGEKSQTRRVVKPQPSSKDSLWPDASSCLRFSDLVEQPEYCAGCGWCPYGQPGDRLWVKETWGTNPCWDPLKPTELPKKQGKQGYTVPDFVIDYAADFENGNCGYVDRWRPSIFMMRHMSRILIEVVAVRVERLKNITEADAKAEGVCVPTVNFPQSPDSGFKVGDLLGSYVDHYRCLWETINGERDKLGTPRGRHRWAKNPWVWVITFKRVEAASTGRRPA